MKRMYRRVLSVLAALYLCLSVGGCSMFDTSDKKVSDMEFTVTDAEELPEEIRAMIEEQMCIRDSFYRCKYFDSG